MDFFNDFCDSDLLKKKLTKISIFVTVYEHLKFIITQNLVSFFSYGDEYDKIVLNKISSKKNRKIRATLLWYKDSGAITEQDIKNFKKMTDMRNTLVHNMLKNIYYGLPENIDELYSEMISLFKRITIWWVKEIEIPINPDFTVEDYDKINYNRITSFNLELIKIMSNIVLYEENF